MQNNAKHWIAHAEIFICLRSSIIIYNIFICFVLHSQLNPRSSKTTVNPSLVAAPEEVLGYLAMDWISWTWGIEHFFTPMSLAICSLDLYPPSLLKQPLEEGHLNGYQRWLIVWMKRFGVFFNLLKTLVQLFSTIHCWASPYWKISVQHLTSSFWERWMST